MVRRAALSVLMGVVLASVAQAQTLTAPVTLNSYSNTDIRNDERPQIATDGAGTWISVWDSEWWQADQYGDDADLFFARSTNNGQTWSTALILNSNAASDTGHDLRPVLATDGVGNWVAVWNATRFAGNDNDILMARSSNNGLTWTAPALVNTNGASDTGEDELAKIATDGAGNWIAIWDSNSNIGGSGTDYDIFAARSTNNGATWTAPALVNSNGGTDSGTESRVELVTDSAGNWVATWNTNANINGTSGSDNDIAFARSTNNGATWTSVALLNTNGNSDAADDQRPGLATDGAGAWVAVWHTNLNSGGSGSDYDIRVARSTNNGATWSAPALLNSNGTTDSGADEFVRVVTDGTGNWLATWDSNANFAGSGTDFDAWYSRSTDNGQTWSTLALLNTNGNNDELYDLVPQLATDGTGNWIGVWESNDELDGSKGRDWDIFTTRFTLAPLGTTASNITPSTAGPTNATSISFNVGFSQAVVNFNNAADLVVTHSGTANSGVSIAGGPQNYTVTVNGLSGSGSFTLAVSTTSDVQASSGGGALTSSVTSVPVLIDTIVPTITLDSAAGDPVGGAISVTATLSESVTNFTAGDIGVTNASVVGFSGSGSSYSFSLVPAGSGLFSAAVAAGAFSDAAGNNNTASNTLSRTAVLTSPTIALSSGAGDPVNGAISVNATLSASSTNFTVGDITPTNATVSGFSGSGTSYTFLLTPTSNGLFSAFVAAGTFTDSAASANLASNTLSRTADISAPTAALNSVAGNPVNGAIVVNVVLSEPSANLVAGDVATLNATVSGFTGSAAAYSFTLTPITSGAFNASIPAGSFSDAAGNLNIVSNTLARTADLVVPTVTLSTLSGDPVTGPIGVSVTLSESSTNFAAGDITAVNAAVSAFSGSGAAYTFTLTPVVSGLFSASVNAATFSDAAGNLNTASNTLSRTANLPNGAGFSPSPVVPLNTDAATDSRTDERPQIATDENGNWVVVWDVYGGPTGGDLDIFVARSTDNGLTWSTPALLNSNGTTDTGDDFRPALATDRDGNWVAVWYSNENLNGTAGFDYDILFSRSTNAGLTWTAPALLNTNGTVDFGDDEIPRIAADGNGNWVTVWDSNSGLGVAGPDYDVLVSRSSDGGVTWTPPALLNSNATVDAANDIRTEIMTDSLGNWVVAWASNAYLGAPVAEDYDIFVSRSTDNGATWATMTRLDPNDVVDVGEDARPALSTDGLGNWVAAWHSNDNLGGLSGNDTDIFVSRSTDNGATWTASGLLNTNGNTDSGEDEFVRLMADGAGNWIAIWDSSESLGGLNGDDYDVFIARSTNNGLTWTPPSIVNSNANVDEGFDLVSQVATDRAGNWVATWETNDSLGGQIGTEWDILVSRFVLNTVLAATSVVPVTTGPTTADSVNFNVAFSENVVNFNSAADLVITHTGTANTGATITGGPMNYVVSITGITGDGSFTVRVNTASDIQNAGGEPLASSVTSVPVLIDNISPTATLSSASPNPTNGAVSVTATLSEASTNFAAEDVSLTNATLSDFAGAGASYTFTMTPVAAGTFSASVPSGRFTDAAGNSNTTSNTLSRTADLTSPTITLASTAASIVRLGITVTATLSEASTNFAAADIAPVNATVSGFTGSGTSYSFTLTPVTSGTFSASVAAAAFTDASGNGNLVSNTLSRTADLTAPTVVLASGAADPVNGAISVSATLSEPSTNFASGDIARVNCSITLFAGSGTSYTFILTPTASGVFSGTVNAGVFTDAVGNGNVVSNTLSRTADITRPTITLSSASVSPVPAGPFTINATLSEPSTDFAVEDITTLNGTVGNFTGSGTSYSFTLTPLANGTTRASVAASRFTDAVGNTNRASNTLSRTADVTAPTLTLSSTAASLVRAPISVTVRLSSGGSTNFAAGDITTVNASVSAFASTSSRDYTFTLTPLANGVFSAQVLAGAFTDAAGNGNVASAVLSRTADLTAPTATLSSTAGDPVTGPITVTVVLTESSTNFTSGDVTRVNCNISNFTGSGTNYSFTLTPVAAGLFSAQIQAGRFTDAAGNTNTASNTLSRTRS